MTGPEVLFAKVGLCVVAAVYALVALLAGVTRWAAGRAPRTTRQAGTSGGRTSVARSARVNLCGRCSETHRHAAGSGPCTHHTPEAFGVESSCGCTGDPDHAPASEATTREGSR